MKILIITDAWHPQVNGVVRTYEHLSSALLALGHSVKVIGVSDFRFSVPMPGYPEIRLPLFVDRKLTAEITAFAPDFIHIATEGTLGWAARRWCLQNKRPFTTAYHTHFPDYAAKRVAKYVPALANHVRKLGIQIISRFHAPAHAVFVATQSLEDELRSWGWRVPMHRLTRGVTLDLFYPAQSNVLDDLPRPIALYVGRIAIEKNLEAFLSMPWHGSKVLVGDGPSLEYLPEKYPQARFVGKKMGTELADYYRAADVFVFPSKTDTFGMVITEALASGLPVAAFAVTGPKDIIDQPFLGALAAEDGGAQELGAAGLAALNCGTASQRNHHIRNHYTWPAVAAQFMEGSRGE